ncbi:hypothetical protein [Porphyromonas miyakawae]|uniref:hypothetical protein n=1 Tax=Porphyromonas miyakawae TaxID=3137470 RepID=UPI00398C37D9
MNENNSEREKVVYGSGFVLPTIIKCLQQELAMIVFIPSAMARFGRQKEGCF